MAKIRPRAKLKNLAPVTPETRKKMTPLEAWADRYLIPFPDALKIQQLMYKRFLAGTHECNGDPHPSVKDRHNKKACSIAWGFEAEITQGTIDVIASKSGLVMDYSTGLWGSVKKDGEYIDDVPSED